MKLIYVFDLLGAIVIVGGTVLFLFNSRINKAIKAVFLIYLVSNFIHHLSNTLEWSGILVELDRYEDYFEILVPIFFGGFLYMNVREQTERELREKKESLLRSEISLLQAQRIARLGSFEIELSTRQMNWSEETYRLLGWKAYEVTPSIDCFLSIVLEEDREKIRNMVQKAFFENSPFDGEYRLLISMGEMRIHTIQGQIWYKENGSPEKIIGIIQDITERKKYEQEIINLNAGLEKRVQQRTKELEMINQELEAFSFSVSHDLRAPLRHIEGYTKIFLEDREKQLDPEGKNLLRSITRVTGQMGKMIEDLLQLSWVNRESLVFDEVLLSKMVREITGRIKNINPERVSHFEIEDDITVWGSKELLAIALTNLLENAWKFTSKKTETRIVFGKTENIIFLRDNGAGFDMRYESRLFVPFQRLHRVQDYEGNGVGLATVKRIVTRHCGKIWAKSAPGQGATFFFQLPERPKGGRQ